MKKLFSFFIIVSAVVSSQIICTKLEDLDDSGQFEQDIIADEYNFTAIDDPESESITYHDPSQFEVILQKLGGHVINIPGVLDAAVWGIEKYNDFDEFLQHYKLSAKGFLTSTAIGLLLGILAAKIHLRCKHEPAYVINQQLPN